MNQHVREEGLLELVFSVQSVPRLHSEHQWEKSVSLRSELAIGSCELQVGSGSENVITICSYNCQVNPIIKPNPMNSI